MKRVLVLSAVLCVLGATPALAAGGPGPAPRKYDFTAKAAGLDRIGQDQARGVLTRESLGARSAPQGSTQKKSFWKTPWPYLIGAGAIVAVVVVSRSKDGGLY